MHCRMPLPIPMAEQPQVFWWFQAEQKLIHLNPLNIRSKIWRRFLTLSVLKQVGFSYYFFGGKLSTFDIIAIAIYGDMKRKTSMINFLWVYINAFMKKQLFINDIEASYLMKVFLSSNQLPSESQNIRNKHLVTQQMITLFMQHIWCNPVSSHKRWTSNKRRTVSRSDQTQDV